MNIPKFIVWADDDEDMTYICPDEETAKKEVEGWFSDTNPDLANIKEGYMHELGTKTVRVFKKLTKVEESTIKLGE